MTDKNWIKLNRSLFENWLWKDKPFSKGQAWIDMLLMANYTDKKICFDGKLIVVKRGSFITSMAKLADRWGWNRKTVKRFLDVLSSDSMVSYKCTTRWTTIIIDKYSVFQDGGTTDGTTVGQVTGQLWDRSLDNYGTQHKKVKESKESKEGKERTYSTDSGLNDAILAFMEYRKKMKKPMTDHTVDLMIKKLHDLSDFIPDQIEILNQSMVNGWQGIFPLKQGNQNQDSQKTEGRLDWLDNIKMDEQQ